MESANVGIAQCCSFRIKIFFFIAFVFTLVSCGSGDNDGHKTEVVFLAYKESPAKDELFGASADGRSIRKISHDLPSLGSVRDYSISPNGKYIAYRAASSEQTHSDLFVANIDGGNIRKISTDYTQPVPAYGGVRQYTWSPDSLYLAYSASIQDNVDYSTLYIYDLETGSRLSATPQMAVGFFGWSPDNTHLAYIGSMFDQPDSLGIYVLNKDGLVVTKVSGELVGNETVFNNAHSFSPDGGYVAYIKRNISGVNEMYVVTPNGANNVNLSNGINAFLRCWSWAPDGSRFAYMADQDTPGTNELYSVRPDGTDMRKISSLQNPNENVSNFAWSPDGSRIAYVAGGVANGFELYTVTPEGSLHTKVSGPLSGGGENFINSYSWTPDSSRLAYVAYSDTDIIPRLFFVNADGGNLTSVSNSVLEGKRIGNLSVWSPDGRSIAFFAVFNATLKLFVVDSNGQNIRQVSQDSDLVGGGILYKGLRWTSDSKYIVYKITFGYVSFSIDGGENYSISGDLLPGGDVDAFDAL